MPHSLDLGADAAVNATLAALRLLERPTSPLGNGEHLVPGVFQSFEPEAKIVSEVESRSGALFSAHFTVEGPAQWLALHVTLGEINLADQMMFGIACRSSATESTTFRPCLRSGGPEGFSDIFFRKTAIAYGYPSLHLDALLIEEHPDLKTAAPWRELVLFFRPETGVIDLQDLRIFVI